MIIVVTWSDVTGCGGWLGMVLNKLHLLLRICCDTPKISGC